MPVVKEGEDGRAKSERAVRNAGTDTQVICKAMEVKELSSSAHDCHLETMSHLIVSYCNQVAELGEKGKGKCSASPLSLCHHSPWRFYLSSGYTMCIKHHKGVETGRLTLPGEEISIFSIAMEGRTKKGIPWGFVLSHLCSMPYCSDLEGRTRSILCTFASDLQPEGTAKVWEDRLGTANGPSELGKQHKQ